MLLPASFLGKRVGLELPSAGGIRERILVRSAKERPSRLVEESLIEDGPAIARAGRESSGDAILLVAGSMYPGTPLCAGRGLGRGFITLFDDSGENVDMLEYVSGAGCGFDSVNADTVDISSSIAV